MDRITMEEKKTIEFHSPQSIRSRVDLQGISRKKKINENFNAMWRIEEGKLI